jgi:hypothetical protein
MGSISPISISTAFSETDLKEVEIIQNEEEANATASKLYAGGVFD